MLELVFVIIVVGILAAMALPRLERDLRQEAADNVLSAIRYTQHLALIDDNHKFNDPKWQQRFWRIYFGTCEGKPFYAIGSDDDAEGATNARVDSDEAAIDPANGKLMWAHDGASCVSGSVSKNDLSPNIFIGKKYKITTITPQGGCTNKYIGFDHMGRPYNSAFPTSTSPDYSGLVTSQCIFTFSLETGESFQISIEPETGFAQIVGQNAS